MGMPLLAAGAVSPDGEPDVGAGSPELLVGTTSPAETGGALPGVEVAWAEVSLNPFPAGWVKIIVAVGRGVSVGKPPPSALAELAGQAASAAHAAHSSTVANRAKDFDWDMRFIIRGSFP